MNFIITSDWDMQIRSIVLNAIKVTDNALNDAVNTAVSEISSYLRGKYDCAKIFAPIITWDISASYLKDTRILFTAPILIPTNTYLQNALVVQAGFIYQAKAAIAAETFNATHWNKLCADNSLFYVIVDNTTASTLPTDISEYAAGDTRYPILLMYAKDIALYHIHSNIAPQNIPELRKTRYEAAIKWLHAVSLDKLNADLPLLDTSVVSESMRLGSDIKRSMRW